MWSASRNDMERCCSSLSDASVEATGPAAGADAAACARLRLAAAACISGGVGSGPAPRCGGA